MKSKVILVCICLLFTLVILTSCGKITDNGALSEPIVSKDLDESSAVQDNITSPSPFDTGGSLILVTSNGETSAPFVDGTYWSTTWTGEYWISGDGMPLIYSLPEIAHELPIIIYGSDFSVDFRENVSFSWLSIFNASFERIHHNVDLSYLEELSEGTYYIIIVVNEQGKFISTENKHESFGYECAYNMVVK